MSINRWLWMGLLLAGLSLHAQQSPTLVRINGKQVSLSEFEQACRENAALSAWRQRPLKERVDRFVDFKLKVAAAEAVGLDTLPEFRNRMEAYRNGLLRACLTDGKAAEQAAQEEYSRMQTRGGRIRVSQICCYLPQNVSRNALRRAEQRMDSIYQALRGGASFAECVRRFSDEKETCWISRLQVPAEFEDSVRVLGCGQFSRPFYTPLGLHIVKVLEREDMPSFDEVKEQIACGQARRYASDRGSAARVESLMAEYGYVPDEAAMDELCRRGHTGRTLFTLDGKPYTGADFALFAAAYPGGVRMQLRNFVAKSVLDCANLCLEHSHPELCRRLQEYRDSLLVHEISEREMYGKRYWNDELLQAYYEAHRPNYYWEDVRYKGIVIHGVNKRVAKRARKLLKKLPEEEWQDAIRLTFNADGQSQIVAEQGVFAPGDNPYVDHLVFKKAEAAAKDAYPFTVVLGEKMKGPEDYQEVYDRLVADYQSDLERRWLSKLRAASKVEINQEVLKTVNNH